MFSIIVVLSVLIATVVFVAIKENNKENNKEKVVQKKCGCGKSQSGFCDGSHNNDIKNECEGI